MGTWFGETIKASGLMSRANRPNTRPHLTKCRSPQKSLALQAPSTQDKPAVGVMRKLGAFGPFLPFAGGPVAAAQLSHCGRSCTMQHFQVPDFFGKSF
jgi:hypothetical protein